MNNSPHRTGRILHAGKQFGLRNEINGITDSNRFDNTFRFFKGLFIEEFEEDSHQEGGKEWFFSPVNYSLKCKDSFDEIKVSRKEACEYVDTVAEKFGDRLKITCPRNDVGFREGCILLEDALGSFFVDSIDHGLIFLGKDPTHPQKDEIMEQFDFDLHKQTYLSNFW